MSARGDADVITTKFALFDAAGPLRKILLNPANGSVWKEAAR